MKCVFWKRSVTGFSEFIFRCNISTLFSAGNFNQKRIHVATFSSLGDTEYISFENRLFSKKKSGIILTGFCYFSRNLTYILIHLNWYDSCWVSFFKILIRCDENYFNIIKNQSVKKISLKKVSKWNLHCTRKGTGWLEVSPRSLAA